MLHVIWKVLVFCENMRTHRTSRKNLLRFYMLFDFAGMQHSKLKKNNNKIKVNVSPNFL